MEMGFGWALINFVVFSLRLLKTSRGNCEIMSGEEGC